MTSRRNRSELGQITILNAFAVIVVLGFAAVAIDGGMLYVQRRLAQNAADTASLAGALALTQGYTGAQVKYIALERAKENGFDDADPETNVVVNWPPESPNPYAGNPNYIQVFVTGTVQSAFAHFVYDGPLAVTVEAIAHARQGEDFAPGYAIFAVNSDECQTLEFGGNPDFALTGGGSIYANSSCTCPEGGAGVMNGNGTVNVYDEGAIWLSGCFQDNGGSGEVNPIPVTGLPQEELAGIPIPDCTETADFPDYGSVTVQGTQTLEPGLYESIKFNANADATLLTGMYCIYGTASAGFAFPALGSAMVTGDGVMLYFTEVAGGFKSSANSIIHLSAADPGEIVDSSGNEWAGMLIYAHPGNDNEFIFTGTSNSEYVGSIYAPGGYCEAQGTSGSVALKTQMICDMVQLAGTGDLDVDYDMSKLYHLPKAVELTN